MALCKDAKKMIELPRELLDDEEVADMTQGESRIVADKLETVLFENEEDDDELKENENDYDYPGVPDQMAYMNNQEEDDDDFHFF